MKSRYPLNAYQHRPSPHIKKPLAVPRCPHYYAALWLTRLHRTCAICTLPHQKRNSVFDLICTHCLSDITLLPPVVKVPIISDTPSQVVQQSHLRLFFVSYYQYPLNYLIQNFKDHEDLNALLAVYALLEKLPKPLGCTFDNTVILPIPTTKSRIRERGFDPVLILAKFLAWRWRLPLWQGMARHDGTRHQRGLNRADRLTNTQADFYMVDTVPVKQVIIFDDVVTTGSTMASAARLLLSDAPKLRLIAVCLAHGSAEFGLHQA